MHLFTSGIHSVWVSLSLYALSYILCKFHYSHLHCEALLHLKYFILLNFYVNCKLALILPFSPVVVTHDFSPSAWKSETGRSL